MFMLPLLSRLPLWWLYRLSDLLFLLVYYVARYRRRVVNLNLQRAFPERSEAERRRIARRFYRFFCDYAVETLKLLTISPDEMKRRMTLQGLPELEKALQEQPFVFFMLGHYGNWEWLSSVPLHTSTHCMQLYTPLHSATADRLFYRMRSRFGADTVAKNDALRRILSLKLNGIRTFVGFIADQGPKPVNIHHWMTFLHQDTPVFTGAERIGKKVGAAAYFLHITRPRRGYYVCRFECLTRCMAQHPDYEFTDLFMRRLEKEINEQPHLWLWSHRRWKHTRQEVERIQQGFARHAEAKD